MKRYGQYTAPSRSHQDHEKIRTIYSPKSKPPRAYQLVCLAARSPFNRLVGGGAHLKLRRRPGLTQDAAHGRAIWAWRARPRGPGGRDAGAQDTRKSKSCPALPCSPDVTMKGYGRDTDKSGQVLLVSVGSLSQDRTGATLPRQRWRASVGDRPGASRPAPACS